MNSIELDKQKIIEKLKKYELNDILNLEFFSGRPITTEFQPKGRLCHREKIDEILIKYQSNNITCYPDEIFIECYLKNKDELDKFEYVGFIEHWKGDRCVGLSKEDLHDFYFGNLDIYSLTELLKFVQWKLGEIMLKNFKEYRIDKWLVDNITLERKIGNWRLRFELFKEAADDNYYIAREIEITKLGEVDTNRNKYTFDFVGTDALHCDANSDLDLMVGDLMENFEEFLESFLEGMVIDDYGDEYDKEEGIREWEYSLLHDFLKGENNE